MTLPLFLVLRLLQLNFLQHRAARLYATFADLFFWRFGKSKMGPPFQFLARALNRGSCSMGAVPDLRICTARRERPLPAQGARLQFDVCQTRAESSVLRIRPLVANSQDAGSSSQ